MKVSDKLDKGMTFSQIVYHLNKKKILSAIRKTFRVGHIHSIMKRKRRLEIIDTPQTISVSNIFFLL